MATDKEKDVKAKKRDMSDQAIDWMMGFAMYTATGQLLSHTSSPSRRLSCLHIILMPAWASRQQLAEIQPTFPPGGGSKLFSCHVTGWSRISG